MPTAAELARKQQELLAKAAASSLKAAASLERDRLRMAAALAAAGQRAQATWIARGRPDRLVIVRRSSIDTVEAGRLQRHTVRSPGELTLAGLIPYVPAAWLSIDGGTARLSATLVLSVGVTLDVGAPITRLALAGGAAAPAAASVYTGGGRLVLRGVTVTSADAVTGAAMPVGPGRPFVVVSRGGRLDAVDATIGDLGTKVERTGNPGLTFNAGSGGSLVRTALPRNSIGLQLDRSQDVRLESVTVTRSDTDGLVLRGDLGTTLVGVRAEGNGAHGVVVSGLSSARPITGISTSANRGFGLLVVGQTGPRISNVTTVGDGAGGLEISRSTGVGVTGFTAVDEPVAVYTHVGSSKIALADVTITGGRLGVVVEKTTTDLQLTGSRIKGTQLGVSVGAHRIGLTDVAVTDSRTGVAIQRGAGGVVVDRLTLTGGKDGIVSNPGATDVVVRDLAAVGVANNAVRALSPGMQIVAGRIDGSATGIDVQAPTTVSRTSINRVDTGIRARTPGQVTADEVDIAAVAVGVDVAVGTPFLLVDSRVHALESTRGTPVLRGLNDLSLPPLSVLGAIGAPLIVLAVLLELVAVLRHRMSRRTAGAAWSGWSDRLRRAHGGGAAASGRSLGMTYGVWRRGVTALAAVVVLLLAGCGRTEPPALVPRAVAATAAVDPAAPCAREAAVGAADTTPAPAGTAAVFDHALGKIVLSAGKGVSLPALSRIVNDPAALRETAPGEWLLGADLEIGPGASLAVTAPAVRRLDLASAPGRFVAVRALGGSLSVTGTCVTSWDPAAKRVDTNYADGRSYLLARDGATMTVDRAELRFLGFGAVESYGLSWRTAGTTGAVRNSIISNLYYGVYSYQVGGLVVTDDEVYNSTVYGIDPHTGSHGMTIARNVVHDNGKHGIILAEDCVDSVLSDNVVYGNGEHGIVLYLRSDRNVVEGNESFRNVAQGINVNASSHNAIRGNRVYDNADSGIAIAQTSQDNTLERNDVRTNQQDGIRLVSQSTGTTVRDNVIGQNVRYGVYVDGGDPFTLLGNTIYRSRYGVVSTGTTAPSPVGNTMFDNTQGDVRAVT